MDLKEFVLWCIEEGPFEGCDLDGGAVQEKAVECGILKEVAYDPERHGEPDVDVEPGDPWFEFTDEFKKGGGK